jgi:hypothetical protein
MNENMKRFEVSYFGGDYWDDFGVYNVDFEALSAEGADLQFRQWARERKIMYRNEISVTEIPNGN